MDVDRRPLRLVVVGSVTAFMVVAAFFSVTVIMVVTIVASVIIAILTVGRLARLRSQCSYRQKQNAEDGILSFHVVWISFLPCRFGLIQGSGNGNWPD